MRIRVGKVRAMQLAMLWITLATAAASAQTTRSAFEGAPTKTMLPSPVRKVLMRCVSSMIGFITIWST